MSEQSQEFFDAHPQHRSEPLKKYYYLTAGEIIQLGDEVDVCRDANKDDPIWVPARHCIGEPAPDPQYIAHRRYRREIKP